MAIAPWRQVADPTVGVDLARGRDVSRVAVYDTETAEVVATFDALFPGEGVYLSAIAPPGLVVVEESFERWSDGGPARGVTR